MLLPKEPFLQELFAHWQTDPNRVIIHDSKAYKRATINELLRDVVGAREQLVASLDDVASKIKDPKEDVFVALLAEPGYVFTTLYIALFSLGVAVVPLSPAILAQEAEYFLAQCGAALLVAAPGFVNRAGEIGRTVSTPIFVVKRQVPDFGEPLYLVDFPKANPAKAGQLIYTSGTTGKPKGVVHSRYAIYQQAKAMANFFDLRPNDLYLVQFPMHFIAGIGSLLMSLIRGTPVELCFSVFNPNWFWRRMTKGDVTISHLVPSALAALESAFGKLAKTWDPTEYEAAINGVGKLRVLMSGSMPVSSSVKPFWENLRGGRSITITYGMTETFFIVSSTDWRHDQTYETGCVGTPLENVDISVDYDSGGEILIKAPGMFTRYISPDPNVMDNVFDDEGYYKTGDAGRPDGSLLYVLGRLSQDVVRFSGWKIFAPEVEDALLQHESISEAYVVAVSDELTGQRVAALVSLKSDSSLNLKHLREWLERSQSMNKYKMPTLLRILKANEQLPTTSVVKKPNKKRIIEMFFNNLDITDGLVEVWNTDAEESDVPQSFDWEGIQTK